MILQLIVAETKITQMSSECQSVSECFLCQFGRVDRYKYYNNHEPWPLLLCKGSQPEARIRAVAVVAEFIQNLTKNHKVN